MPPFVLPASGQRSRQASLPYTDAYIKALEEETRWVEDATDPLPPHTGNMELIHRITSGQE